MIEIFYWILLLIWLVLGLRSSWATRDTWGAGGSIIAFLLFVFIGLKLFGNPLAS